MKVVVDTMLWVSYCTEKSGFRHKLIDAAHVARVRFFVSDYILFELAQTLSDVFEFPSRLVKSACQNVGRLAKLIKLPVPRRGWVAEDPDDDPIIHTALASKADYLITADRVLLNLNQVQDVRIISVRDFANLVGFPPDNDRK